MEPARVPRAYAQIRRFINETPLAMRPEAYETVRDVLSAHFAGHRLTEEEAHAFEAASKPRMAASYGAIAVIPIYGVICPKASLMTQYSGGTSLAWLAGALNDALGDPTVGQVILDIDSPGGFVDMVPETAALIRAVAAEMPVTAVANTQCASAAYWLACQASEVVVTFSGEVGSIGVFTAHDDISAAMEKAGVKTTLISAGRFKTEGNPYQPLSAEAQAAIQGRVDDVYGMFVADVARGRGVTPEQVTAGFGEGRMVGASQAVAFGMADRVDTLEGTIARLSGARGGTAGFGALDKPARLRAVVVPGEPQIPELDSDDDEEELADIGESPVPTDDEAALALPADAFRAYSTGR